MEGRYITEDFEQHELKNIFADSTILVAEDIEINREILHLMLECTGINIEYAKDGKTALEMFSADPEKYNLIFTDINMPEMDGLETARKIRAQGGRGKDIPIIAVTANVLRKDIEKCTAAGMNDYIGKPLEQTKLINKLQKYLTPVLPD